ncbi:MAG: NAD(P)/FAD-dependent oxidoreductase [Solirubrobacteraceae bacterium]
MIGEVDLAVVGGGIVGLSTAVAAADGGLEIRCFEAARPGAGQSAGRTRIFRHRHAEPELVELAVRARAAWDRWEQRFGRELVGREGVVMAGPDLESDLERLTTAGVEVRALDPAAQREALPIAAPLGETALLDVHGGAIRTDRAVDALVGDLGERLVLAEVVGLHPADGHVMVDTAEGVWRARRAVVCAGVDTTRLARALGLDLPVETGCQLRATFAVSEALAGGRLACLLDGRDPDASSYAAACDGGRRYTVGLGSSELAVGGLGPAVPADAPPTQAIERTSAYVARVFPGLDPEPVELRLCWTTKLPWSEDAFAAWQHGPVTVFAGHNLFKFAPVLADLLVEAARAGRISPELAPDYADGVAVSRMKTS